MRAAELEIERERLNIDKERLHLEKVKERNASIRFYLGVLLVGMVTWAVNASIDVEQGRRILIQDEREFILKEVIEIHKASYEEQRHKLGILQKANFSPENQIFLSQLASGMEEKYRHDLAIAQAQLQTQRLAQAEEEAKQRAADEAAAIAQAAQIEAEKQRMLASLASIGGGFGMSDTAGPW